MAKRRNRRPVNSSKRLILATSGLAPLLLIPVFALLLAGSGKNERIAHNVWIQGVSVAGLSAAEADQNIQTQWLNTLNPQITLKWPNGSRSVDLAALGVSFDIPAAVNSAMNVANSGNFMVRAATRVKLWTRAVDIQVPILINDKQMRTALKDVATSVARPPQDAKVKLVGEGVEVEPGIAGQTVDIDASMVALKKVVATPEVATCDLVIKSVPPDVTADELGEIEVVLASYSTKFRPSQKDRTHNLSLAIKALRTVVLMPGDDFSMNSRVGPRITERGYRDAPIFVNGEVEPSTGGGICQVATTLYNAALLAGLEVTERHHHSRPVDYAPAGRDATVYWGQYDLRIRNNLPRPVLISGAIGSSSVSVRVIGSHKDKVDVTIDRSNIKRIDYKVVEKPDPELELDKRKVDKPGRKGTVVTVTRIIKREGKAPVTQRLHTDVYAAANELVLVGTKKPEPIEEPVAEEGKSSEDMETDTGTTSSDASSTAKPKSSSSGLKKISPKPVKPEQ